MLKLDEPFRNNDNLNNIIGLNYVRLKSLDPDGIVMAYPSWIEEPTGLP